MEDILLKNVTLFDGRVEIRLPEGFVDMPQDIAKRKYPSKYRPPVILMSKDTLVNYGFHLVDFPLPKEQISKAIGGFLWNAKRVKPAAHFSEIQYIDKADGQVAFFSYDAAAADADIFQIIFVTDIEGKVLYGIFNCLIQERENWEEIALSSIKSIKEVGKV